MSLSDTHAHTYSLSRSLLCPSFIRIVSLSLSFTPFHHPELYHLTNVQERFAGRVFSDFVEGPITFMPTYKFDAGCDRYDSSDKARVPSWTDRVLFRPHTDLLLTQYTSVPTLRTSDHRPVKATFLLRYADRPAKGAGGRQSAGAKAEPVAGFPAAVEAQIVAAESLQSQEESTVCGIQ